MTRVKMSPDERQAEIIAVAAKLFAEQGYENTSVSDIVRAVGVAQGTFYWHFKSKEDVLNAVTSTMSKKICMSIIEVAKSTDMNAVAKFMGFIHAMKGIISMIDSIEHFHRSENRAFHDEMIRSIVAELHPYIARVIAQGVEEGVFTVTSPERSAALVLATFQGLPHDIIESSVGTVNAWLDELLDFALRGLGYR